MSDDFAVVRGDVHYIRIGKNSNVQDNSVLHGMLGKWPVVLGDDVTVGHTVTLHGCVIEDRCLIPSPKIATYDLKPEMSAYEVTDEVIRRIHSGKYDIIVLNFANMDMVGHTGIFEAAVKAIEAVDKCVGRIVEALKEKGGVALITADHGNAEQMINFETGEPFTAHTSNPVKCIYLGNDAVKALKNGKLCNLAPTLLDILGVPKPQEMTGKSLLIKND